MPYHRHRSIALSTVFVLAALGCGDADRRIKELDVGASRDSALKVLGGSPTDSTPFLYDVGRYLVNSRSLEVWYYDPKGRRRFRDSVPGIELTPVVVEKGVVSGKGWTYWDSVATSLNIQNIPHEAKE